MNSPNNGGGNGGNVIQESNNETFLITDKNSKIEISAYPNPFTDYINIDFNNTSAGENIAVDVYDVAGRMVMRRNFGKLTEGAQTLRLNAAEGKLTTGVYLVTLTVNGKPVAVSKLVKTKQ
jgi:phage-related protein